MKFIASTIVASAALATSAAALESAGWSVENLADEIEGAKEISAILQANETDKGPVNLIVMCSGNTTSVMIQWPKRLPTDKYRKGKSDDQERLKRIELAWDGGESSSGQWLLNGDRSRTTFVGKRRVPIVNQMVEADELVVKTDSKWDGPFTATFDLTGAQAPLRKIATACDWTLSADKKDAADSEASEEAKQD